MARIIGVVGGISPVSTAYYYRLLISRGRRETDAGSSSEILIHSLDFNRFTDYERTGNMIDYTDYLIQSIDRLADGGADICMMAANSPHSVIGDLRRRVCIPLVDIVDAVGRHLDLRGYRNVLLLGIRFTMEHGFYTKRLANRGIRTTIPGKKQRDELDEIIFGELVAGNISDFSRERLYRIIAGHTCDAVILGCTELPLFVSEMDGLPPLVDSARLHVEEAIEQLHALTTLNEPDKQIL